MACTTCTGLHVLHRTWLLRQCPCVAADLLLCLFPLAVATVEQQGQELVAKAATAALHQLPSQVQA